TTDASLLVSLAGPARATASVQVGGTQVASVQLAADGTGEVSVPLQLGDNVITVSVGAATSAPVTVHRTLAPVVAPAVASPTDGTKVSMSTLRVTGTSAPGSKVVVFVGLNRVAEVTADASGQFAVDVTLKPGSNLVYAAVDDATGLGPKSKVIEVIFNPPAASSGPI